MYDSENLFDFWSDSVNYFFRYIAYTQRQTLRIMEKAIFGTPKRAGACPQDSDADHTSRRKDEPK